jgi:hypothetical protein
MIKEWKNKSSRSKAYLKPVSGTLPSTYKVVSSGYNSSNHVTTRSPNEFLKPVKEEKLPKNAIEKVNQDHWHVEVHSPDNHLSVVHTFEKVDEEVYESTQHRSVKHDEAPVKK